MMCAACLILLCGLCPITILVNCSCCLLPHWSTCWETDIMAAMHTRIDMVPSRITVWWWSVKCERVIASPMLSPTFDDRFSGSLFWWALHHDVGLLGKASGWVLSFWCHDVGLANLNTIAPDTREPIPLDDEGSCLAHVQINRSDAYKYWSVCGVFAWNEPLEF